MSSTKDIKNIKPLTINLLHHINQAFLTNSELDGTLNNNDLGGKKEILKAKTMHTFSKLCYKLLKQLDNEKLQKILVKGMQQIGHTAESLAISII